VWAKNAVSLTSNIQVFGNATSSTSSITLSNNSTIFGNAKAATTVTGGTVGGQTITNSPSGAPPVRPFPQIPYTPSSWTSAGYTIVNYSSCALAQAFINAVPVGNWVVRITPACALVWGGNTNLNFSGNIAIITDGSFTLQNQNNWNGIVGSPTLFVIRPYQSGLDCSSGAYDITVSNNTSFNNLKFFGYTQCNINFGNNNASGVNGQLIGGTVNITNQMVLNYVPIVVPGFNLTGFKSSFSYKREIPS
jgi:hypothetical protein